MNPVAPGNSVCLGCFSELPEDELTSDGLCFGCDQPEQEGVPDRNNLEELANSIVDGVAARTGVSPSEAAVEIANAEPYDANGEDWRIKRMIEAEERRARARERKRPAGGN